MPVEQQAVLSPNEERVMRRLLTDNKFYNRVCIKIKTDRGIEPMIDNQVQDYIEYRAEDQKKRTGKVRQVLVKARQQGGSEKISSRGFKFVTQNPGKTVYILSHEASSTATLFAKVERYYRYCPDFMKPGLVASNRNQMKFDNDSEYTVGTAGSENTGRSNTVQFAHLSEPAHYDNDEQIKAGLLQTVSDAPGTEIWWESTARGKNWFYHFCMKVLAGETEYELIFVPWFWSDKYSKKAPAGFEKSDEENELASQGTWFNNETKQIESRPLSDDQLYWRRIKVAELGDRLFKQEYPAFLEEAFQSSDVSFHDINLIDKARRCDVEPEYFSPLILGVDPARDGGDRTVIAIRQGRKFFDFIKYKEMDQTRLAGILANLINRLGVDKVFMDWAHAHGTIDILRDRGYGSIVEGVNFGEGADDPIYLNKRSEMGHRFDAWLKDGNVNLPDDDDMAADFACIPMPTETPSGKLKFPPKEEIKKRVRRSPDIWDSAVLTFAYDVRSRTQAQQARQVSARPVQSELTTQQRRQEIASGGTANGGNRGTDRGSVWEQGWWRSRQSTGSTTAAD